MSKIETIYQGNFITKNVHIDSAAELITDAPLDNNGKGDFFSPTDLLAAAVAACVFTIAGQAAQTSGFSIDGAKAITTKKMTQTAPRRIDEIDIVFDFSMCKLNEKQQTIVKRIADTCPVANSLHPDVKKNVTFCF